MADSFCRGSEETLSQIIFPTTKLVSWFAPSKQTFSNKWSSIHESAIMEQLITGNIIYRTMPMIKTKQNRLEHKQNQKVYKMIRLLFMRQLSSFLNQFYILKHHVTILDHLKLFFVLINQYQLFWLFFRSVIQIALYYNLFLFTTSMQDLNCVFEGLDGRGAIFISTVHAARNLPLLKKYNIGAVLTTARGGYTSYNKEEIPFYLYLPADDNSRYDLSQHFEQTYQFIQAARKQTNVLIHCMAGISRSATITAAYLIRKFQYSFSKVLTHLQRKRAKIDPNPGFMKQLALLQKRRLESKQQKQQKHEKEAIALEEDIPLKKNESQRSSSLKKQLANHIRSLSSSPNKSMASSFLTPPNFLSKNTSFKEQEIVFKNTTNMFVEGEQKIQSPTMKRGQSIGYKIDRIKSNLIGRGVMANDAIARECPSPCKVYSPLLYRNRPKIAFSIE